MRDLYWRNGLRPRESDRVKIHAAAGSDQEREAAFTILLNDEKKAVYDSAHRALSRVGYLRRHLGLAGKGNWRAEYGDFLEPMKEGGLQSPSHRPRKKGWRAARIVGWLLITLLILGLLLPLAYLLLSSYKLLPPL